MKPHSFKDRLLRQIGTTIAGIGFWSLCDAVAMTASPAIPQARIGLALLAAGAWVFLTDAIWSDCDKGCDHEGMMKS